MLMPLLQATVEEALWFSARLRLAKDINNKAMWAFIYEVVAPAVHHTHCQQQSSPLESASFSTVQAWRLLGLFDRGRSTREV